MKKKCISILFAFVFAFLTIGGGVYAFTNSLTEAEAAYAALTSSQTRTVQTKLKRWGYYTGTVDGIYGNLTRKAGNRIMGLRWMELLGQRLPQRLG